MPSLESKLGPTKTPEELELLEDELLEDELLELEELLVELLDELLEELLDPEVPLDELPDELLEELLESEGDAPPPHAESIPTRETHATVCNKLLILIFAFMNSALRSLFS